ncbi:MAG: hypothetical protein U0Z53_00270 [Blastocatellia bacterium]
MSEAAVLSVIVAATLLTGATQQAHPASAEARELCLQSDWLI